MGFDVVEGDVLKAKIRVIGVGGGGGNVHDGLCP